MSRTAAVTTPQPRALLGDEWLSKRDAIALAVVSAIAVAVRIVFVSIVRPVPVSDFGWYYQHAVQITTGLGFTTNGFPTAYWPLGWPYFLAAVFAVFGPNAYAGEVVQAILNGLTAGLVFVIAYRIAGGACALAAGLIYAFLPSAIEWSAVLASEPLYTFLVTLAICMWVCLSPRRIGWFAASGILIGAATLVRPTALFLWVPLLIYLWYAAERKTFRDILLPAAIVFAFAIAAIAPETVRNYRVFHTFVLICNTGGLTLWTGNNPDFHPGDTVLHNAKLQSMAQDPRTEVAADQLAEGMAISYIRSHPAKTVSRVIPKLRSLYARDDEPIQYAFATDTSTKLGWTVRLINRAYYYGVLLLALAGVVLCFRRPPAPAWLLVLLVILYNTMPFVILPAYDRYHFQTMPYFAVFAGFAAAALLRRLRRSSASQTI